MSEPTEIEILRKHLETLAAHVDRLEREKAPRQSLIAIHEEQINVRGILGSLRANPDAPNPAATPVVEWMTVEDPDAAAAALTELRSWVRRVWTQYDPINPCWPWHPQVVAELAACKRVWDAAMAKGAPVLAGADWHQRFRVGAHRAVTSRLKDCNDSLGHKDGEDYYGVDHQALAAVAAWWASTHGERNPAWPGPAPGLSLKGPR